VGVVRPAVLAGLAAVVTAAWLERQTSAAVVAVAFLPHHSPVRTAARVSSSFGT
jgi:hypothetical protein